MEILSAYSAEYTRVFQTENSFIFPIGFCRLASLISESIQKSLLIVKKIEEKNLANKDP